MKRNYWDLSSFGYDFFHNLEMDSYKSVAELINKRTNISDKILEIGCGTGILTNLIYESNKNIIGIDNSSKMLDRAIKKNSDIEYINMDACKLEFSDSFFDFIVIANLLHIVPYPNIVIEEVLRTLKENGYLSIINFYKPTTIREKFILDILSLFGYNVHNAFNEERMISLLNGFNLELLDYQEFTSVRTIGYTLYKKMGN